MLSLENSAFFGLTFLCSALFLCRRYHVMVLPAVPCFHSSPSRLLFSMEIASIFFFLTPLVPAKDLRIMLVGFISLCESCAHSRESTWPGSHAKPWDPASRITHSFKPPQRCALVA